MPPLVQSSNWISLARQAGKFLARASARPSRNVKPIKTSTLPQQAKEILRHTFPSLFTPAHLLELQPAYLHRSTHTFARAAQISRAGNPLGQAARGFRTTARNARPTVPAPMNVGLGTARGYASSGAASHQMMSAKVPMMMRALASLLDSELELDRTLPHPSKYTPYDIQRISMVASAIATSKVSFESVDEIRRTFAEYFSPAPQAAAAAAAATTLASSSTSGSIANLDDSNLLVPSQIVTPGVNTTLTIPLAPSYHSILELPRQEPYAGSDLGVRKFASLFKGILTINQIVHNRASHFIIPLMDKLDSLGITFDQTNSQGHGHGHGQGQGQMARCEQWVSYIDIDDYQLPETISIKFYDRSSDDVRRILGESLRSVQEGDWWALTECHLNPVLGMDENTTAAIQEGWEDESSHGRGTNELELDTSQLVMPLIDLDEPYTVYPAYRPSSPISSRSHHHGEEYGGDWTDIDSGISTPSTPSSLADPEQDHELESRNYSPYSDDRSVTHSNSSGFVSSLSIHLDAVRYEQQTRSDGGGSALSDISQMSDSDSDPAQREWQVLSDSE